MFTPSSRHTMELDPILQQEDDPITATYPVFINPSLPSNRRLLVLQHPNRTDDTPRAPPTEIRLKTKAGMVEVDMPLDSSTAYDKEKGLHWGRSLHSSTQAKSGGSHGLAGGFGFGAVQQRGGRTKREEEDDALLDWNEAVRQGKVLTTQTLGGQYPDANDVQYMVGVFQGKNLHLTPVSSIVHLRPQLHHIDATTHLDRLAASKDNPPSTSTQPAARAIHMTIKTTVDGDTLTTETMADRLRSVQSEPWRTMRYTDENDEAAWDVYNESLFLRTDETKEKEEDDDDDDNLESKVPKFATHWGDTELLEAVSGIKKPELVVEVEPEPKVVKVKQQEAPAPAVPVARPSTRGRGGARGRGGRPKPPTMNVD